MIAEPIISPDLTIEDIHKIGEYHYELTKDMTTQEKSNFYNESGRAFFAETEKRKQQNGKTKIENCSAGAVYRIARELGMPMESLLEQCAEERGSFELYKSAICHRVKDMGDIDFIIETLEQDEIRVNYQRGWYAESFYLLAMLDYISRLNGVPPCTGYDDLRRCRLSEPLYPSGILAAAMVADSDEPKQQALREAIPEFLQFNIVESGVRNVV